MSRRILGLTAVFVTMAAWWGCTKPHASAPPTAALAPTEDAAKASAETPALASTAPTIQAPLFWTATKGDQTIYLLGTIHMGVDANELPPRVWEAFAASKHVAIEADINDLSLVKAMLRTDKSTLEADLGPEAWAQFVAVIGEAQAKSVSRFKPFVAAMMLQTVGLPATPGIEMGVIERANTAGKPLAYLEAGALQMRLLEKWMTIKAFKAMLNNMDKMKASNAELIATYRNGDEAAILATANSEEDAAAMGLSPADAKQMEFEMLEQRNQSWIAPIETLAATGPAFIAVGAMHLIGDKSVNTMLAARGWKVERN